MHAVEAEMLPVCASCWSAPASRCAGRMSQLFGMVAVLWVEEGQMNQLSEMMAVLWVEERRMNQLPEMMEVLWTSSSIIKTIKTATMDTGTV